MLPSCMPEANKRQVSSPSGTSQDQIAAQSERITRLETELHEVRLLFTSQLKRIEEAAATGALANNQRYPQQNATPPQQVVIMPPNPVVTHRWDQKPQQQQTPPQNPQYPHTPQRYASSNGSYTIQAGDTLSEIAEANGISLSSLMTSNPGINPLRLRLGQSLVIPQGSYATAGTHQGSRGRNYTVQAGDTLSEIAESHGIRLTELLAHNPGLDPRRLRIGKSVQIPSVSIQQPRPLSQPEYREPSTRYASPHLNTLQTQVAPQTSPAQVPPTQPAQSAYPTVQQGLPTQKILVRFPYDRTFGEIAKEVGVDLSTLQYLNNCSQSANSRVPANSTIFIPDPSE